MAFIADGLKRNFPFIKRRINVIAVISIRCTRTRARAIRRARWENRVIGSPRARVRVIAIWNYYDLQLEPMTGQPPSSFIVTAALIVTGYDTPKWRSMHAFAAQKLTFYVRARRGTNIYTGR